MEDETEVSDETFKTLLSDLNIHVQKIVENTDSKRIYNVGTKERRLLSAIHCLICAVDFGHNNNEEFHSWMERGVYWLKLIEDSKE